MKVRFDTNLLAWRNRLDLALLIADDSCQLWKTNLAPLGENQLTFALHVNNQWL